MENTSALQIVFSSMVMGHRVYPTIVDFTNSGSSQKDSNLVDLGVMEHFVLVYNLIVIFYFQFIPKEENAYEEEDKE